MQDIKVIVSELLEKKKSKDSPSMKDIEMFRKAMQVELEKYGLLPFVMQHLVEGYTLESYKALQDYLNTSGTDSGVAKPFIDQLKFNTPQNISFRYLISWLAYCIENNKTENNKLLIQLVVGVVKTAYNKDKKLSSANSKVVAKKFISVINSNNNIISLGEAGIHLGTIKALQEVFASGIQIAENDKSEVLRIKAEKVKFWLNIEQPKDKVDDIIQPKNGSEVVAVEKVEDTTSDNHKGIVNAYNSIVAQIQNLLSKMEQRENELSSQNQTLLEENKTIRVQNKNLEKELSGIKEQLSYKEKSISELQHRIDVVQHSCDYLLDEKKKLEKDLDSTVLQFNELEQKYNNLEEESAKKQQLLEIKITEESKKLEKYKASLTKQLKICYDDYDMSKSISDQRKKADCMEYTLEELFNILKDNDILNEVKL